MPLTMHTPLQWSAAWSNDLNKTLSRGRLFLQTLNHKKSGRKSKHVFLRGILLPRLFFRISYTFINLRERLFYRSKSELTGWTFRPLTYQLPPNDQDFELILECDKLWNCFSLVKLLSNKCECGQGKQELLRLELKALAGPKTSFRHQAILNLVITVCRSDGEAVKLVSNRIYKDCALLIQR